MKVDINKSSAEIIGEVKENQVTIDPKNLQWITHILSSNLYSQPMQSFLREIVSNAIDSHKEAGVEEPIILDIGDTDWEIYIRIQDFGTGLGEQKFNEVYKFMGSSTKRESNDYIGSFGIGKFSVLAISDSAYITDRYNGIETKYLMYKDQMSLKIDRLYKKETTERNGVEVLVYLEKLFTVLEKIRKSLDSLVYFDNLYVNLSFNSNPDYSYYYKREIDCLQNRVQTFNNRKIKLYENFGVSDSLTNDKLQICVGKVLYPLENSSFVIPKTLRDTPVQLIIPIGSVNVTPNREQILYTPETIEFIQGKINAAYEEILSLVRERFLKNLETLKDIGSLYKKDYTVALFDNDKVKIACDVPMKDLNLNLLDCTVFGHKINNNILTVTKQLGRQISWCKLESRTRFSTKVRKFCFDTSLTDILESSTPVTKFDFLKNTERLEYAVNAWIRDSYSEFSINKRSKNLILPYENVASFIDSLTEEEYNIAVDIVKKLKDLVESTFTSLDNDIITNDIKAQYRRTYIRNSNVEEFLYVVYSDGPSCKLHKNLQSCIDDVKTLYVYCDSTNVLFATYICEFQDLIGQSFGYSDIKLVKTGKKYLSLLENLDNFISVTEVLNPDSSWIKTAKTYIAISEKNWISSYEKEILLYLGYTIPRFKQLHKLYKPVIKYSIKYGALDSETKTFISSLFQQNKESVEISEEYEINEKERDLINLYTWLFNYNKCTSFNAKNLACFLTEYCAHLMGIQTVEQFATHKDALPNILKSIQIPNT